jgi:5-methylcytosine-specific restriction endonuclease McrA
MSFRIYDWKAVQQFHDEGHGFVECQLRFQFSHTAWVKAVRRGDIVARPREGAERRTKPTADRRRIYDWAAVQAFYDAGHTYRQCRAKFGFSAGSWTKAVRRGELRARARCSPLQILLATSTSRRAVKARLLQDGLLENVCSNCGITDWLDLPLSMHLDHINGIKDDHRLENLRMLCPNCHSQTPNYCGSKGRSEITRRHAKRR